VTDFQFVKFGLRNYVGRLTLDRPPVNALNRQLVDEIVSAARLANEEVARKNLRVLILDATGKHFCAGADLRERMSLSESEVELAVQAIREAAQSLYEIQVPTIAAIQGSAIGGGMELALAVDIRVLSEEAKMGLRETALAVIPGAGGTQRLPRLIGYSRAVEWIATARLFPARECISHGVANRVVPAEQLEAAAMEYAERIAANAPLAVQAAKAAIRRGMAQPLAQGLEVERQYYSSIIPTKDRLEALNAFDEKRPPDFCGE